MPAEYFRTKAMIIYIDTLCQLSHVLPYSKTTQNKMGEHLFFCSTPREAKHQVRLVPFRGLLRMQLFQSIHFYCYVFKYNKMTNLSGTISSSTNLLEKVLEASNIYPICVRNYIIPLIIGGRLTFRHRASFL